MADIPIQKPPYAEEIEDREYVRHLRQAGQVRRDRHAVGDFYKNYNREVLLQLAQDPQYLHLLANLIQRGDRTGEYEFDIGYHLSELADDLAPHGQAVEIVTRNRGVNILPPPNEPGIVPAPNRGVSTAKSSDFKEAFPRLGFPLKEGMIIVRGNVDTVYGMRGGIVYVDGSVNKLEHCQGGIVYVNGDLYHLGSTEREVIAVAGRVHEYVQDAHHPSGGFYTERLPSPFIFTNHQLEGKRVGEKIQHHVVRTAFAYTNTALPFEGSYVVDKQHLEGWSPQDTASRALELCRERVKSDLDKIKGVADQIHTTAEMGAFYNKYVVGYLTGKNTGFWEGMRQVSGPGD